MRGSLYPDGVVVDQVALRRTEITKAEEILRNRTDFTCRGVLSGGVISVNAIDKTRIDLTQVSGYTPKGEYLETDSAYYSLALSNYTANTVNLVCLVYTEANTANQPHESNGSTYPTRAEMAWRVRIYTAAEYAALPMSDANLANDAQDRILVRGKVTANGVGIDLTSSNISGPLDFNNILYTIPRSCSVITGVEIRKASASTPLGAGTLTYIYTAPSTYTLMWTTSNGAGVPVPVTVDGTYTLLDGAGEYVIVLVAMSMLPLVGTFPMTEAITVYNLYYQEMPRLSAEDHLHRNYTGTGVVTPTNPHGTSLDDLSGESLTLLNEHQDVQHCNGIWRGSNSSLFSIQVVTAPVADTFYVTVPTGSDLYYINGKKLDAIDLATNTIPTPANQTAYYYEICVSDNATMEYCQKAYYPTPRTVTGTWIVDMSPNYPAGTATLSVSAAGPGPWDFVWDGGPVVTVAAGSASRAIRLYSSDGVHWIDLWVNTSPGGFDYHLPVANAFDIITINTSLTDGSNEYMQIGGLLYWYFPTAAKWTLGYPPTDLARYAVDKRTWGTTGTENMSTGALADLAYLPNNELGRSGVLLRRNGVYNEFQYTYSAGLSMDINGGAYYCRGQRLVADSTQTVYPTLNATHLVWVDLTGTYQVANVTGTFGGDIQAAMQYICGFTQELPNISDVYHESDEGNAPERGVLLYYLETNATTITRIVDFMQNVNQVSDPWSVACRVSATSLVHSQAAYDSLFTAFEYAKLSMYGLSSTVENRGAVTVTVTGVAEVSDKITQPEYVNVRGTLGVSAPAKSLVRISGPTSVGGSWVLSPGCKVSDLCFYTDMLAATNHMMLTLADYVTVERCAVSSAGAPFLRIYSSGTSLSNVLVRDNMVSGCVLFSSVALVGGLNYWTVTGNTVASVPASQFEAAIQLTNATKCLISGNTVSVADSGDGAVYRSGGIRVVSDSPFQAREISIRDNRVSVGNSTGVTNSVAGIYLDDVWMAEVSGNTCIGSSLADAQIAVGVYLKSLAHSSVHDNSFNTLGCGIYYEGSCRDVSISSNKLYLLGHRAIQVVVDVFPLVVATPVFYGLKVEDNLVFGMVKGTTGGLFSSAYLGAIDVYSDLTVPAPDAQLNGVSVSRNVVAGLSTAASTYDVFGISVDIAVGSASCKSVKVDGNQVSGLFSGSGAVRGILLAGNATAIDDASICNNSVSFDSTTSAAVYGIDVTAQLDGAVIEANSVYLFTTGAPATAQGVAFIYSTGGLNSSVVSGNVFYGLTTGASIACGSAVVIGQNVILSYGYGLYLGSSNPSVSVVGNQISVVAYKAPVLPVQGVHGVVLSQVDGANIKDNVIYLAGPVSAAYDIPTGSSGLFAYNCKDLVVDGCKFYSKVATVNSGTGGTDMAYLLYYAAGHAVGGQKNVLSVKNCVFDDRFEEAGTTKTPLHGLYVVPGNGYLHTSGDSLAASVMGCTFNTTNAGATTFNVEGLADDTPPAFAPYVMYIPPDFGAPDLFVHKTRAQVHLSGNAIHSIADFTACPYVYLYYYSKTYFTVAGPCYYAPDSLCNFVNGVGSCDWPGP